MPIAPSELILNDDGSIYHLNLLPEDISDTIITVGDPERVEKITKYFDSIEVSKHKREFFTQTGLLNGQKITVISTGIGTDNIDIVINELDALVNINFETREINSKLKSLRIIRIGTSGSIQPNIDIDSFLISKLAVGFDSLMHHYNYKSNHSQFEEYIMTTIGYSKPNFRPYVFECSDELYNLFNSDFSTTGITATNVGFYGPQGRKLRLDLANVDFIERLRKIEYSKFKITNLEMETSGIYGLSSLLGHKAISLNAILANRYTNEFSLSPDKTLDKLIKYALNRLCP